jgi:hypothetical protein
MNSVDQETFEKHKKKCGASFETISEQIAVLNRAVYGDKENDNLGMAEQVKEMHGFFFSTNVVIRAVKNGFLALAFLSALIYGIVQLWKEFKK